MNTQQTTVLAPAAVAAPPGHGLHGRDAECKSLAQLIADVRAGHGRAMILRGEAGVGKTALLELPRELSPMELAGGFGLPGPGPLGGRVSGSFASQIEALPAHTRRLVQLAAADLSGDPSLVWARRCASTRSRPSPR
jgi:hypothetical protein